MKTPRLLAVLPLACAALLAGCTGSKPYVLDTSHTAVSQDSRVRFIVLHYTAGDLDRSLQVLGQGRVSSHYLVDDKQPVTVYALVDENRAAWHAGVSSWYGQTALNTSSIGIEIVHDGPQEDRYGNLSWAQPYDEAQIQAVIALVRDIAQRHGVAPRNIVGHSDIAPLRKQDPGPLFPWKRLADAGLGRWYDEAQATHLRQRFDEQGLPDIGWFQDNLIRVGYALDRTGLLDNATRRTLSAFQMHYRPARFDGQPDAETAAILQTLP
ncbi:MAG: N-acetylmuramoyl-L-alanine amidase [Corticimicrobacter sp.]|uniref:N-acetylmuramoyl-L-alanine amidase n=1 Tax=Corticimicrobacter sp. TaxID=2678536 RepID=UPI0032D9FDB2